MARTVFVSYSQPDRECAFELVARLEAHGISVWIAPRDIAPSADWAEEIVDAIGAARIMVLVFSAHSNGSQQVRREVERAVHKQLPVLPFRIEEVLPSKSLEYFLSAQHWLDAFPAPREPHYAKLCTHLDALLNATAAPATARDDVSHVRLPAEELQLLERQLAHHLGPVAKHLITRAAAQATDRDQLIRQLAAEIEAEPARRHFLESCRIRARPAT